jgi:hypothetical protein
MRAQWRCKLVGEFQPYPADVNSVIEAAYQRREPHVTFSLAGEVYKVTFASKKQTLLRDPGRSRDILREEAPAPAAAATPARTPNVAPKPHMPSTSPKPSGTQQPAAQTQPGAKPADAAASGVRKRVAVAAPSHALTLATSPPGTKNSSLARCSSAYRKCCLRACMRARACVC